MVCLGLAVWNLGRPEGGGQAGSKTTEALQPESAAGLGRRHARFNIAKCGPREALEHFPTLD